MCADIDALVPSKGWSACSTAVVARSRADGSSRLGEQGRHGLTRCPGNGIQIEAVEGHEYVLASRTKDSARLFVRPNLVGNEHDPEEAEDEIEALVVERELLRVRCLKADAV
jgi:hypothetical protein